MTDAGKSKFGGVTAEDRVSSEYRRLKQRDRRVMGLEDFTEADLEALRRVEPSAEAAAFDSEMTE